MKLKNMIALGKDMVSKEVWNDCPLCLSELKLTRTKSELGYKLICLNQHYRVICSNSLEIICDQFDVKEWEIQRDRNTTIIRHKQPGGPLLHIAAPIDFDQFSSEIKIFELIKKYDDAYGILDK